MNNILQMGKDTWKNIDSMGKEKKRFFVDALWNGILPDSTPHLFTHDNLKYLKFKKAFEEAKLKLGSIAFEGPAWDKAIHESNLFQKAYNNKKANYQDSEKYLNDMIERVFKNYDEDTDEDRAFNHVAREHLKLLKQSLKESFWINNDEFEDILRVLNDSKQKAYFRLLKKHGLTA